MNNKKTAVIITLIGLIVILLISITYKTIDKYKEKEYNLVVNNIIKAAKRCFNEEICNKENITLETLYEKLDIDEFVNPYTKKPFKKTSYITVNTYEFILE